ncbi:M43 family zinc metalloprotease [uncultured Flavobacterium sp.]|uniref:M43 family zinc metalloprotease n=1 Tax=uncultured Flavobacterium sp. TaxID=165435 RepID=UPI0025E342E9|nr:M43 family zinc metalloprotease [uncultured Flavobacterium sp.]
MKKITFILCLLFSMMAKSQTSFVCGTEAPPRLTERPTPPVNFVYDPDTRYVLNVYFHVIKDGNGLFYDTNNPEDFGTFGGVFGENEVLDVVKLLNVTYNPYNIYFKYIGMQEIWNDITNTGNSTNISNLGVHRYDAYNLYVVNNAGGYTGYASGGNTRAVFSYYALLPYFIKDVVPHEMGHCLNLHHIFDESAGTEFCEHVTRDRNDPNYNADYAGDAVEDTPAHVSRPNNFTNCVYNYDPNFKDCIGEPYVNLIPNNYMSYETTSPCPYNFTPGQVERMRSYLQNPSMYHVRQTYNTIASLYQAFDIKAKGGQTIVSVTDNGDGTGTVCRNKLEVHRYQKGFDYVFDRESPHPVTAGINEIGTFTTPGSFFVKINQVNPAADVLVPRDITKQVVCTTERLVRGQIVSMPFLGSTNLTTRILSETEVNDAQVYETLEPQQYHIVKKETESGAAMQTVIYKQ